MGLPFLGLADLCGVAWKQVTDDFLNPSQPSLPGSSSVGGSSWLQSPYHTPPSVANAEANPGLAPRCLPTSSAFCDRWKWEKTAGCGAEGKSVLLHRGAPSSPVCVMCVWSHSVMSDSLRPTLWTVAYQAPPSMGFFQARVLEWVAISFSRGSPPRDRTRVSCIAGRRFTVWATLSRWHLYVPWLQKPTQNLDHHTQLCWEEKWGREGALFLFWSPVFQRRRVGVLKKTLRLWGEQRPALGVEQEDGTAGPGVGGSCHKMAPLLWYLCF